MLRSRGRTKEEQGKNIAVISPHHTFSPYPPLPPFLSIQLSCLTGFECSRDLITHYRTAHTQKTVLRAKIDSVYGSPPGWVNELKKKFRAAGMQCQPMNYRIVLDRAQVRKRGREGGDKIVRKRGPRKDRRVYPVFPGFPVFFAPREKRRVGPDTEGYAYVPYFPYFPY